MREEVEGRRGWEGEEGEPGEVGVDIAVARWSWWSEVCLCVGWESETEEKETIPPVSSETVPRRSKNGSLRPRRLWLGPRAFPRISRLQAASPTRPAQATGDPRGERNGRWSFPEPREKGASRDRRRAARVSGVCSVRPFDACSLQIAANGSVSTQGAGAAGALYLEQRRAADSLAAAFRAAIPPLERRPSPIPRTRRALSNPPSLAQTRAAFSSPPQPCSATERNWKTRTA